MAASNLRRLTSDHADLHTAGLPPHYLFPPSPTSQTAFPDDLTNLTILLTGPQGTPYSQGLWRVHLKIPHDYPKNPPKASFRTRIWHPNVEETTGAVCVDTLKRDWEARLTLRDVLITISCLLIHPNPDSALNSAAGSLLQDDYEEFARQARLMTSIHAPIPADLKEEVTSAKRRGEDDAGVYIHDEEETDHRPLKARKAASAASVVMKKKPTHSPEPSSSVSQDENIRDEQDMSGDEDQENDQENDPLLSPSLVTCTPPSPRRNVLGKRPLSVLSTSTDPDIVMVDINDDDDDGDGDEDSYTCNMTSSEKNIAANNNPPPEQRKPPAKDKDKPSIFHPDNNNNSSSSSSSPFSSFLKPTPTFEIPRDEDIITKENLGKPTRHTPFSSSSSSSSSSAAAAAINSRPGILKQKQATTTSTLSSRHTLSSKITKPSISATARRKLPSKPGLKPKPKPRIGVRRL